MGEPTKYFWAEIGKFTVKNKHTWYISARLYLKNVIGEIKQIWGNLGKLLPAGCGMDVPERPKYHLELHDTKLLDEDNIQLYQSYIGIIRWEIKLGRLDLYMDGGVMARFSAFPREGHMVAVLKTLAYCKKYIKLGLVFDPEKRDFSNIDCILGTGHSSTQI